MTQNFLSSIWNWVKNAFTRKRKSITPEIKEQEMFVKTGRPGRGAYFMNNRRRTKGRNLQYVKLADGRTRVIRHETI